MLSDFEQLVTSRESTRAFQDRSVPKELIVNAARVAARAPSNYNTQPWYLRVVNGERCDRLRRKISDAGRREEFSLDVPFNGDYQHVYQERQIDHVKRLQDALGIARDDEEGRAKIFGRNFEFFDAPAVAFVFMQSQHGLREAIDVGMFAQTFMLALKSSGVDSCPQTALGFHSRLVKDELKIDDELSLLFGISIGYADKASPAASLGMGRASLDDFFGYEETAGSSD
ncbi:MAG: nitroreductase [Pseudomonadales bacterium]